MLDRWPRTACMRCSALHLWGNVAGRARHGIEEKLDLSRMGSRLYSYDTQVSRISNVKKQVADDNLRWSEELFKHNVHASEDLR